MQLLVNINEKQENKLLFITEQASMTVQKSFQSPSLRILAQKEVDLFPLINNLLYLTSMSLNVSTNLDNYQAFELTHMIMEDYKDVKFDELVYIFKQGKKGLYGAHYNKLDMENICKWINGYYNSEEYNEFLHNRHKIHTEFTPLTIEQKANWAKTLKQFRNAIPENRNINGQLESFTDKELQDLLQEYTTINFQDGIDLINKEIKKRTSK
jgi:hypothetical protein